MTREEMAQMMEDLPPEGPPSEADMDARYAAAIYEGAMQNLELRVLTRFATEPLGVVLRNGEPTSYGPSLPCHGRGHRRIAPGIFQCGECGLSYLFQVDARSEHGYRMEPLT